MDAMERELQEYHMQPEQHGYANEIFSLCWDVSQIGKWYPDYKLSGDRARGTWVYASSLQRAIIPSPSLLGMEMSVIAFNSSWTKLQISLAGIVQLSIIQKPMTVIKAAGTVVVQGIHLDLDRPQERHGNLPGLGYAIPICQTWIALVEGLQDFDMKTKVLPEESVVWFMLRRGEECCSLWSHDGSVQSAKAHGLTAARERSAT
ncbi:hypothetical protein EDC04DRAFT_2611874 [Pisolithus marmoratus]|nr:hypothetical protein EDC04DRAFT_2611874 [Pisolithus marmoratus]